ncbi:hypothetical protein DFJ74DRAFT_644038 [Hyaloraphidium curvatum]|nr:hypothetical protein DFJ74DRAFT_644038 [Hyaloraphidium curvatum]
MVIINSARGPWRRPPRVTEPAELTVPHFLPRARLFLHRGRVNTLIGRLICSYAGLLTATGTARLDLRVRLGATLGVFGGIELFRGATLGVWEVFPGLLPACFLLALAVQLIVAAADPAAYRPLDLFSNSITCGAVGLLLALFALPPLNRPFARGGMAEQMWHYRAGATPERPDPTKSDYLANIAPGTLLFRGAMWLTFLWVFLFLLIAASYAIPPAVWEVNGERPPTAADAILTFVVPIGTVIVGIALTVRLGNRIERNVREARLADRPPGEADAGADGAPGEAEQRKKVLFFDLV